MPYALHRIRFQWADGLALDLEWTKGSGRAVSVADLPTEVVHIEQEAEPDLGSAHGIPPICYRPDGPALFKSFQLRENTDYFVDITIPVSKASAEAQMVDRPGWPFNERMASIFQVDPPRRWRIDECGRVIVSGFLRLRNHAGILDLRTLFGSGLRMEVVCQKIGYLEEFKALLDSVAEELTELLLQYDSPVSADFNISNVSNANEAGLLFQLRNIMSRENLPATVDEILGRFHSRLVARQGIVELEEVEEADIEALASELDVTSLYSGGPLQQFFRGFTPRSFPILEEFETTDTPENRYVKYFLEEVSLLSTRLRDRLEAAGKQASARGRSLD